MQLAISDVERGERKASFAKDVSSQQIRDGSLINEATVELLSKMDIQLTETSKRYLAYTNSTEVRAETALSKGITAQQNTSSLEALMRYYEASAFDYTMEAASRFSALASEMNRADVGTKIVNEMALFDEGKELFKNHPPFELVYGLIQEGETDFDRKTANLSVLVDLIPSQAGFTLLEQILNTLDATGKRHTELAKLLFAGQELFKFTIDFAIINANGKNIAQKSIALNTKGIDFAPEGKYEKPPAVVRDTVRFQNVKIASNVTPNLTVKVLRINKVKEAALADTGYVKIIPVPVAKSEMPDWVRSMPPDTANAVYFRARSYTPLDGESYMDVKVNALANVLMQLGAWKEVKLGANLSLHEYPSWHFGELNSQITSTIVNTVGFYQEAEWVAEDGVLYVLFAYYTGINPKLVLPKTLPPFVVREDRVYFVTTAVSGTYDTDLLASMARRNGQMQASFWAGTSVNSGLTAYHKDAGSDTETESILLFIEGIMQCTIWNYPLLEEVHYIQRETDNLYH